MTNEKKYYLGLDIGTSSCGYALTDEKYNLARLSGKDVWGVRLFDEAQTAVERRQKRSARRRLIRKRLQNHWLREVFEDEIYKVDPNFFTRLKYSNLQAQDKITKNLNSKYSLFNDTLQKIYTDKHYYLKYKTVYHLRKDLLKNPADDIRLLYLAIHSILTHRGHFLYETNLFNSSNIENIFLNILNCDEIITNIKKDNIQDSFNKLFLDFNQNKTTKEIKENLINNLCGNTKSDKAIVNAIVCGKLKINDIFELSGHEKVQIDFSSDKFEEAYNGLNEQLTEEQIQIVDNLKDLYSAVQLKRLLGDFEYISEAMVSKYDEHKKQLLQFKKFVKKFYPSKYSSIFKASGTNNYASYIYQSLECGSKQIFCKKATRDEFYAFVKKELSNPPENLMDNQEYELIKTQILNDIDNNSFLVKIRSIDNAVFPNQLYLKELKQILKINSQKFNFLNLIDDTGLSNIDKICQIVSFKIPYFIGPVGNSKFGWSKKISDDELRPWTLNKIVDFDTSEDGFIQSMTNKCTFLPNEDVLPKDSLTYSKFRILNDLNNLKINGNSISPSLKQNIFNNLFKKYKKVTIKLLKEFLLQENIISKEDCENITITGIDKEFANNYSTYVTLNSYSKFDDAFINENYGAFEKIVKYHTIISDKSRFEKRVKREFDIFTDEDIKFLKSLNFSKWGTLSCKLLKGIYFVDKTTGERLTILDAMWDTNQNLQQVLNNNNYTLKEILEKQIEHLNRELQYTDVENCYCSPSVKRGAWQAISIINEIRQKLGKYPDKIFVEVTRHDETKGELGRKDSRFRALEKKYKNKELINECKNLLIDYNKLLNELTDRANIHMRSDKLYLYFLQLGKCAYTGRPISIIDLYNDNKYNIDHIYPRSLIKDDSLDNKVLVETGANEAKKDTYPLSEVSNGLYTNQKGFWQFLLKNNLMSVEKYSRLIRTTPLSADELDMFVNRQMVSTNQETKSVIDLLAKVYDNPRNIIFSKANYVSLFRNKYGIYKSRNINDLHHAKDAYLNIVVGNIMFNRFTNKFWLKNNSQDKNSTISSNVESVFNSTVWNNSDNSIVWHGKKDILRIKNICDKNDCLVSIMPFSNYNGGFYDETIYKSRKNDINTKASQMLKGENNVLSNIDYYGGYNSVKNAYFVVVESIDKKGRTQKTIEAIPILLAYKYRNDNSIEEKIIEYLERENNIKVTKLICKQLKYKTLLKINGGLYVINGKTGDSIKLTKMNQWFIKNKYIKYIKVIEKYLNMPDEIKSKLESKDGIIVVSPATKENCRQIVLSKEQNLELYELIIAQLKKKFYSLNSIIGISNIIEQSKDKFMLLSVVEQVELLNNLVKYIGGSYTVDLTKLGGSKMQGATVINKNITELDISYFAQSPTGLVNKEIKL